MCVAVHTKSDVKFVDRLDERLACPICKNIFIEPWQTSCGHRFCRNCLDPLLRPTCLRCPLDGEIISQDGSFRDRCCEREVLDLKCSCRYKKRSCDWNGELRYLKTHEDSCQFGDVQCLPCDQTVERRHVEQHRTNDCINRAIKCTYCGKEVPQTYMKDHLEVCLKFPIDCILCCGQEAIPRDMMEEHVTTECPKAEVLCPFTLHGCDFKGKRDALDQHIKESLKTHLDLMNQSGHEYHAKNRALEDKVSRLETENSVLEQQFRNQNEELVATRINIQTQRTKISIIEKSLSEQRRHTEKLLHDLQATRSEANGDAVSCQMEEIVNTLRQQEAMVNSLQSELVSLKVNGLTANGAERRTNSAFTQGCERRLDRTEHQLALHEIQLSEQDLQIQMLEATSYNGTYVWKIDHYSRRFQESVSGRTPSIYSPPFYVGRFGYKVCARLYPNGDGIGKGTHMSMFFVILRGEYDALLPWPFIQKVHFRLIDQDGIRDTYDAFRPEPHSSSFKRPTSDMNIASGCPTFIPQSGLREGGYIRDDIMFVKVTVDMANLHGDLWK
ncbi:hypothetical protein ACROYT_G041280 [Oculina patagonica]